MADDKEIEVHESEETPGEEQSDVEEFNKHIEQLVKHFVQQEIQGLDQRLRDLETVSTPWSPPEAPEQDQFEDVPWYQRPDGV